MNQVFRAPVLIRRGLAALILGLAAVVAATSVAPAQQAAKPAPQCGVQITDKRDDNNVTTGDLDNDDTNLDIVTGWFAYDAAKGDKAVTANLLINDLNDTVPDGATGMVWNIAFTIADGTTKFVRRLVDFSGVYYEYGSYIPVSDTNPIARYQYEGGTEGQVVEGKDGVLTIVVSKAVGAEAGKEFKTPFASASSSKQGIPGAVPSPTRGLSTAIDTAPDDGAPGVGGKLWKVAACPSDGTVPAGSTKPPADVPTAPPPATPPSESKPSPSPPTQSEVSGPLPVKVLTTKAKPLKKGKKLRIKLSSKEAISRLAAQLRKGTKVVAKGRLARLNGTGALTLKLSKKLVKGTYVLDLAGSDARGAHRITQATIKVR